MTFQAAVLLFIIAAAFTVFIGGWVRVGVVGLLVFSCLALTGLVPLRGDSGIV